MARPNPRRYRGGKTHGAVPSMQVLFDIFPVIVFFVVYRFSGIYAATAAIMVTMAAQIAYQWFRHRKVSQMFLASGILVGVLGTVTLVLRNPLFIQWKPTIFFWFLAAALLGSRFVGRQTLVERAMGQAVQLESAFWRQLNKVWVIAFTLLGAINLYVVYHFSESTWVSYKLFGTTALLALVVIAQAVWIWWRLPPGEPTSEK